MAITHNVQLHGAIHVWKVVVAANYKTGHGNYPQCATALCYPYISRLHMLLIVKLGHGNYPQCATAVCYPYLGRSQLLPNVKLGMAITDIVQLQCAIHLLVGRRCC